MRALVYQDSTLRLEQQYPCPEPIEGEALIRVLLTGICNTDLEILRGYMDFQGIPGHEFVGLVEDIYGDAVRERYAHLLGQRVVGEINAPCRQVTCEFCRQGIFTHCPRRTTLGIVQRNGAFAEYLTLPVENLYPVPETVSDEEAIFVEPLAANFELLEQIHLKPTETALILGDGKMGQLAAQVLSLIGCEVVMVGKHQEKLQLAEEHGVTGYLLTDPASFQLENDRRADLVVECTGSASGLALAQRLVKARGVIALKSTVAEQSQLHLAQIVIDEIRVQGSRCGPFAPALRALKQHRLNVRPLISASYSLHEGVHAFAHASQRGALKILLKP
uniref:Alcohol dehydrogenase n=1 Tax=Thermosporothrix sp. COM3 TaxID=2490863 RepID=A0A455SWQ7_9CHLR|nr:alcohol dehydrogenase [Thermosporothrix sp. COM3]